MPSKLNVYRTDVSTNVEGNAMSNLMYVIRINYADFIIILKKNVNNYHSVVGIQIVILVLVLSVLFLRN